ncbi:hypothetical protein NLG97_g3208 [Lecanicillium saksenae]|uniref:Uncharacterized protein n=1 Tax=Lecanicillium saksenae TaxID=468837 RepID=A0ACC1R2Q5_9HYPO|nr:hypothetical protein NLG97_g3208 [Lecanicillium saksenae]
MFFSTQMLAALVAALPLSAAMPQELSSSRSCASEPSADILKAHARIAAGEPSTMAKVASGKLGLMEAVGIKLSASRKEAALADDAPMKFDTYFHIIQSAAGTSKDVGYVTAEQIANQMTVLNDAYAPMNIGFNFVNTTYHVNKKWANTRYPGSAMEGEIKGKTRHGGRLALNLYYIPTWDGSGVCNFPDDIGPDDKNLHKDGCMQSTDSFPDGTDDHRGFLTVHEVGHWLGLLHTFQGGCNEEGGDFVADTPAEKGPNWSSYGCVERDSCPLLPGLDPIENHMDYSHESCKTGFTSGQGTRAREMALLYRYADN